MPLTPGGGRPENDNRGSTRRDFLARMAGAGAGLALSGGAGAILDGLVRPAPALAAVGSGVQRFVSRPDLHPIAVDIVQPAQRTAPGYLFVAPSSGPGSRGVLILDDAGEVVWFHSTAPQTAMNFRAAVYEGRPVLTWWEGKSHKGTGVGECVIVDRSYAEIARFRAGHGRPADLHEFLVTPKGTALVTSEEVRRLDLTSLGGRASYPVMGSVVQELEIPSARVLFDWRSLDHIALDESHQKIGPRFDYFHANSIGPTADGNLLVSARNTWAVYKIDRHTGKVIWRLGGKRSDFHMGKGTFFAWQHDARSHDGDRTISIFDDAAAPPEEKQSRGLFIALDTKRMRASLERAYTHTPPLLAKYTGSTQLLPNGNVLVGWGSEPYLTEFAPDGSVRFDAKLADGGQTYRALRFPWSARPTTQPTLIATPESGTAGLYVSWNGATDVVRWQLLTGASPSALQVEATVPRAGFETPLTTALTSGYAVAVALDAQGAPLGRSAPVKLG